MSDPRVIKKYPNRRLYDTVESRYITLADVRKLVVDRIDFVVIDKKSQNDITRSILLQVIADQEHSGEPVMSRDFLSHIIRTYGGPLHSMIGSYLEQSVKLFVAQQREMRERGKALSSNDTEAVTGLASRNYQRWRSVQDEIYSTLVARQPVAARKTTSSPQRARAPVDLAAADRPHKEELRGLQQAQARISHEMRALSLRGSAIARRCCRLTQRRRYAWTGARDPDGRLRAPSRAPRRLPSACR